MKPILASGFAFFLGSLFASQAFSYDVFRITQDSDNGLQRNYSCMPEQPGSRISPLVLISRLNGITYACNEYSGPQPGNPNYPGNPAPPPAAIALCIRSLSTFCADTTPWSPTDCMNKVTPYCKKTRPGFTECTTSTANYCNESTSQTGDVCFQSALDSCSI